MYSDALLNYFHHPRNTGELPNATVRVKTENPVCGDVLELALQVTDNRIATARFKAQGCVPAMACASALTELIIGKSLNESRAISREDLLQKVNGVPHASSHAIDLALDALRQALSNLRPVQ